MTFYVDGACSGNPGPGGFGVVGFDNDLKEVLFAHQEFCDKTTNNREELKAVLYVLKTFGKYPDPERNYGHVVWCDSSYVVNTVNIWMYDWATHDWKRSNNKTPENLDIIKEIYDLNRQGYHISLVKVSGHKGINGNELADGLATGKIKVEELIKEDEE